MVTIVRNPRHPIEQKSTSSSLKRMCGFKQDCSMRFDPSYPCGFYDVQDDQPSTPCNAGDTEGHWLVPCNKCEYDEDCDWSKAIWQPIGCSYNAMTSSQLKLCLDKKNLLFIGDSTNRGVSNYVIERINGTLYDWDKTHTSKVYNNVNNNRTRFSFAYYPHFWLPLNHRPTFKKILYQLIKSSLPVENSTRTVLVVGGVHWLSRQHVDLIVDALQRKGLSGITKVVKGLGAGFHQAVEGMRHVPPSDQPEMSHREQDVLSYAKEHGFHVVATFNMTISRYKDFMEGKCACHFHKVARVDRDQYRVQGDINAAYSQILLHQICHHD